MSQRNLREYFSKTEVHASQTSFAPSVISNFQCFFNPGALGAEYFWNN
jgi:hypothetical protein